MPKALVQTQIDADIRDRATEVLGKMGLSVSDEVRILLTRTASEGFLPIELMAEPQAYDTWFRTRVDEAMTDERPDMDYADVDALFAEKRKAAIVRQ